MAARSVLWFCRVGAFFRVSIVVVVVASPPSFPLGVDNVFCRMEGGKEGGSEGCAKWNLSMAETFI